MPGCVYQKETPLIIGLTGGIASGKSTAAETLHSWGAYVIDADKLGHRAYLKDTAAFHAIVDTFGADTVGEDGEIDRRILGGKVFGQPEKLEALTQIVWPSIRTMAAQEIKLAQAQAPARVVVLEAAVLLEAGWQDLVDILWVTVIEKNIAIKRATSRDGVDAAAVEARINSQLSNAERTAKADVVIDNSGSLNELQKQLQTHWLKLEHKQI